MCCHFYGDVIRKLNRTYDKCDGMFFPFSFAIYSQLMWLRFITSNAAVKPVTLHYLIIELKCLKYQAFLIRRDNIENSCHNDAET